MISKKMYQMLSCFPRDFSDISYQDIVKKSGLTKEEINWCMVEHGFMISKGRVLFRTDAEKTWEQCNYSLADEGIAEIDNYEIQLEMEKINKDSLRIAKYSLYVSSAAIVVAIISLVVSIIDMHHSGAVQNTITNQFFFTPFPHCFPR